jgi:hypothetical protein
VDLDRFEAVVIEAHAPTRGCHVAFALPCFEHVARGSAPGAVHSVPFVGAGGRDARACHATQD